MGYTTDLTDRQWELIEEFFVVYNAKKMAGRADFRMGKLVAHFVKGL